MIGLYYYLERRPIALPLLNVSAEAAIKELAAQVKLTQTYGNDANFPIEAVYAFPVPARAAVCSFVMIKHDGTRVVGLVQEKQEARETYHTAITQGRQASLMEQQTPDVFQVAVGNIPPKEQVKIELVYATELSEDEENDSVRFHLPVHIGARYGQPPTSPLSPRNPFANPFFASASPKSCFLEISMSVESIAPITKISCPSHAVSTELGPNPALPNFKELPFSNYARVSLSSNSPLNQDFVLTINTAGLDAPRCVAEVHPDPSHDTVALALTFVSRFKLPDPARQEFIFLVDRSGSMDGARIAAARKALVVLLRSLPHKDSLFQIMSFGNGATALWERGSKPYNQETLEQATSHVDGMEANYGGTEMRGALQACFAGRHLYRPTSVFVLTDGEAWNLDAVLGEVGAAVGAALEGAPLRVSVLGIGDAVSTAMCEGIARVGRGVCILVGEQETSFTGKIARLLKASKTPVISNIFVDWGRPAAEVVTAPESEDDFEMVEDAEWTRRKTLNIFDPSVDPTRSDETQAPPPPPVILPAPSAVQQSPFKIRNVFPGVRLNVYAILKGRTVPKSVIFRGSTPEGAEIELPIPVTLSRLQNDPDAPTAIHALAARKIIQDLEDGQHALHTTLSNPDDADLLARTVKASIVRLGKTYSISSKHTSFVAVDEAAPLSPPVAVGREEELEDTVQFIRSRLGPPPPPGRQAAPAYNYSAVSARVLPADRRVLYLHSDGAAPRARARAPLLLPPPPSAAPPVMPACRRGRPAGGGGQLVARPTGFSGVDPAALAALSQGNFDEDSWYAAAEEVRRDAEAEAETESDGETVDCDDFVMESADSESDGDGGFVEETVQKKPQDSDPLERLARLQSFDGHFSPEVFTYLKITETDLHAIRFLFPPGAADVDVLAATVLAMVFLQSGKLSAEAERDAWEGMYEKAKEYVEDALAGLDGKKWVDWLEAEVKKILV